MVELRHHVVVGRAYLVKVAVVVLGGPVVGASTRLGGRRGPLPRTGPDGVGAAGAAVCGPTVAASACRSGNLTRVIRLTPIATDNPRDL